MLFETKQLQLKFNCHILYNACDVYLNYIMTVLLIIVKTLFLVVPLEAKSAEEWKNRIIYQLLTDRFAHSTNDPTSGCSDLRDWCGGTFKGIQRRLDYIQDLGANAIWISPIVLNTEGGYHGYWAKDIHRIEDHFGTEQDLKDLVDVCHRRDIWVMVDVVPNHMGYPPGCDWNPCPESKLENFTGLEPFTLPEHYHTLCAINFSNPDQLQFEVCRLANLPDLNQTVPFVRHTLLQWISNLTFYYGFDGYRVDTTRHVAKDFWPEFQSAAGVFLTGEVAVEDNTSYVAEYQKYMHSVLNFPTFAALKRVFNNAENMTTLKESLHEQRNLFKDVSVLGLFSENHDQPRFLSLTNDLSLYKNVLAYTILGEGIPIIYYGSEQLFNGGGDPHNRESLWPYGDPNSTMFSYMKTLTSTRRQAGFFVNQPLQVVHVSAKAFVFRRGNEGQTLIFLTNFGHGVKVDIDLHDAELSSITDGTQYLDIFTSKTLTVSNCLLKVVLLNGEPMVLTRARPGTGRVCGLSSSNASCINTGNYFRTVSVFAMGLVALRHSTVFV